MATYDLIRDLPFVLEDYALDGLEQEVSSQFVRRTTVIRLRGEGHEGVGEDVTYDGDDQLALQGEGPTLPLAGEHTIESFSHLLGALEPLARRAVARRLPRLPPLGVRERGARPRAPAGRPLDRRRRRARAAAGHVRRLDALPGSADDRARAAPARALSRPPLQARRGQQLDGRARRRARRPGRRRLDRPQGRLQRDGRRPAAGPGALRARRRRLPGRVDRGPRADARDRAGSRAGARPDHLGRADPFGRRTSTRCPSHPGR